MVESTLLSETIFYLEMTTVQSFESKRLVTVFVVFAEDCVYLSVCDYLPPKGLVDY